MINEQIRDKEVRLVGEDGEQLGVVPAKEALRLAHEANLDLVKVAPQAKPPVCKIIDYGKYRYEMARKDKEARKKQKVIDIKEIRFSPNIDVNDLNTKMNHARKFLSSGNRVKVSVRFRGREMAHTATGRVILEQFAEKLSDIAVIDKPAKLEGRSMVMFLSEKRS
ncbi:MAG: translation initiation factor IF-3 [Clostridia bacterium]|nr:translation initiation factor IF-3 [Lachnospiraceae bacterium]NCC01965.1 translation initiation factor IF-3 [Clostridia bacterium]NCD04003.1 translation initiation factor IF-3 [Clostridia bacterium]